VGAPGRAFTAKRFIQAAHPEADVPVELDRRLGREIGNASLESPAGPGHIGGFGDEAGKRKNNSLVRRKTNRA
jgi:hypothetical protein